MGNTGESSGVVRASRWSFGGVAGGSALVLAVVVGAMQLAAAYHLWRRPWSLHRLGVWGGAGSWLLLMALPLAGLGASASLAVFGWAIYRRRAGDKFCAAAAVLLWTMPLWFAFPEYGKQAGMFALLRDRSFNRGIATEMLQLYRQESHVGIDTPSNMRVVAIPLGKQYPLLGEIRPFDAWFDGRSLNLIFGWRQAYVLRVLPGAVPERAKPGFLPGGGYAVLYFRPDEDAAPMPVVVLRVAH